MARWKPFFIGQRSLAILRRGNRRQLIGFAPKFGRVRCGVIWQCVTGIAGRITSVARSTTLGRTISLALLSPKRIAGDTMQFRDDVGALHTQAGGTTFYDAANISGHKAPAVTPAISLPNGCGPAVGERFGVKAQFSYTVATDGSTFRLCPTGSRTGRRTNVQQRTLHARQHGIQH
jgi:hypothetical protein